jgi:hypothetical protein
MAQLQLQKSSYSSAKSERADHKNICHYKCQHSAPAITRVFRDKNKTASSQIATRNEKDRTKISL